MRVNVPSNEDCSFAVSVQDFFLSYFFPYQLRDWSKSIEGVGGGGGVGRSNWKCGR